MSADPLHPKRGAYARATERGGARVSHGSAEEDLGNVHALRDCLREYCRERFGQDGSAPTSADGSYELHGGNSGMRKHLNLKRRRDEAEARRERRRQAARKRRRG